MSLVRQKQIYDKYRIERSMPDNYKAGELDFCKDEFSYFTNDIYLKDYRFCTVNYAGHIYDNFYKLDVSTLVHHTYKPNSKLIFYKLLNNKKKLIMSNEKYLVAYDEWTNNHYHWTIDFLQRLWCIKELIHNYVLLLPNHAYVKEVGLNILEILSIKPKRIEFIKYGELYLIKNVTTVTITCQTGRVNDRIISDISSNLRASFKASFTKDLRKIYISRSGANNRKVLNESQVVALLKARKFEILKFEELSLLEQFKIASTTNLLISIHGAGMTNMIVMPKGSTVIEFRRDKIYHNQCYWHLANSVSLNYNYLFGTPDSDDVVEGKGCNLTICIKKLKELLDNIDIT